MKKTNSHLSLFWGKRNQKSRNIVQQRRIDEKWHTIQRQRANRVIQKYIRVKEPIQKQAQAFYDEKMKGAPVLGMHFRGTDKGAANTSQNIKKKIGPEAYILEAQKYLGTA